MPRYKNGIRHVFRFPTLAKLDTVLTGSFGYKHPANLFWADRDENQLMLTVDGASDLTLMKLIKGGGWLIEAIDQTRLHESINITDKERDRIGSPSGPPQKSS